jgi:predicted transcriptional regulator
MLQLRLPRNTNAALDELASKYHRTKSELVRQVLLREVASSGLSIDEPPALEALHSS